jgi:hypothetical protein
MALRLWASQRRQSALRKRYGIDRKVPIARWSDAVQDRVNRVSSTTDSLRFALTSGSTCRAKRIPYTRRRLRSIKRASFEAVVQTARALRIRCPSLFVLAALQKDESLSSLLLHDTTTPSLIEGLVMPSKYLSSPEIASLVKLYGATSVRLWLMVLSNPAILYATNPSTLAVFLNDVEERWEDSVRLIREAVTNPSSISNDAWVIARRVVAAGWRERLQWIAASDCALPIVEMVPALRCYCCWDGGYVTPFLNMIRKRLPSGSVGHVPMYSMSTECLQTQTCYVGRTPHYLPITPGVLYEFIREGDPDESDRLLEPRDLEVGGHYAMVVSDRYGLRRYQTEDVFLCVGRVGNLPDLRFVRRRGLAYSFTGEKLTGPQVEWACQQLLSAFPPLREGGVQVTLIPTLPRQETKGGLPHYTLVMAHAATQAPAVDPAIAATTFDECIATTNSEFADKRFSARLGQTRGLLISYDRFAQLLMKRGSQHGRMWNTQFKLVPLYNRRWDEMGLPDVEDLR